MCYIYLHELVRLSIPFKLHGPSALSLSIRLAMLNLPTLTTLPSLRTAAM